MFKCAKCGQSKPRDKLVRVVDKIRRVTYLLQVCSKQVIHKHEDSLDIPTIELNYKTVRQTHGTEIVQTSAYCYKCQPKSVEPVVTESIKRKQIVTPKSKNNKRKRRTRRADNGQKEKE